MLRDKKAPDRDLYNLEKTRSSVRSFHSREPGDLPDWVAEFILPDQEIVVVTGATLTYQYLSINIV